MARSAASRPACTPPTSERELAALAPLADRGPLPLRPHVAITVDAEDAADPAAMLARLAELALGLRPARQVAIDNMKMFFDGVIEYPTQTAALLRPYRVNKGTKDEPRWVAGQGSRADLLGAGGRRADDHRRRRRRMAGARPRDRRPRRLALRSTRSRPRASANGGTDNRHTITHLELVEPKDFPRFASSACWRACRCSGPSGTATRSMRLRDYLGPKRWRNVYPAGCLAKAGAMLCGGSDWPVDPLLPFRQIEMAVNRTADEVYKGEPKPLFRNQGISCRARSRCTPATPPSSCTRSG